MRGRDPVFFVQNAHSLLQSILCSVQPRVPVGDFFGQMMMHQLVISHAHDTSNVCNLILHHKSSDILLPNLSGALIKHKPVVCTDIRIYS